MRWRLCWSTLFDQIIAGPCGSSNSVGEKRYIGADVPSPRVLVSAPRPASLVRPFRKRHSLPAFDQWFDCRVSMRADDRAGEHDWRLASGIRERSETTRRVQDRDLSGLSSAIGR